MIYAHLTFVKDFTWGILHEGNFNILINPDIMFIPSEHSPLGAQDVHML